ncbi:MAG: oligosaccharide flippase family protein [Candidatus Rokubacteria bacterium]|nr:oligosaccharide flippase family protein [Candidatus Rokubacteria bacterium]
MSARGALLRNTFWYGLVTVGGLLTGVVMSVVLARGLGPARMGEYSYVLWVGRTLTAIATLGFALATTRYTATALAKGDAALAWGFVQLLRRRQLATTAIVAAIAIPVMLLAAPGSLRWPLVVVCLALFPVALEHIYSHAVYGGQRYELTAKASAVKMSLHLLAAVTVLSLGFDILGLVIANTIGTTIACAVQRGSVRRIYPRAAAPVPDDARAELRAYLVPLSVVVVLDAIVWDRSEVFFLRLWASPQDVAFYSLAFGLATKAMVLPEVAVGALLPTFSALHGRGASGEFRAVYRSALRHVALAAVAIASIGGALAPGIVGLLYGEQYLPVAALFAALVSVAAVSSMRRVAWSALRGAGDRRWAVTATSLAAAVNLAAAALLIPSGGVWGALAANSAAQGVATLIAFAVMARTHDCGFPIAAVARIALAGTLALVTTMAVLDGETHVLRLLVAGATGFTVYAGACAGLRVVGRAEWHVVSRTLRRRLGARERIGVPSRARVRPGPGERLGGVRGHVGAPHDLGPRPAPAPRTSGAPGSEPFTKVPAPAAPPQGD